MQKQIIHIPHELLSPSESRDFEGEFASASLSHCGNTFSAESKCTWDVSISNIGGGVLYIEGNVECTFLTQCVRCLEDASIDITGTIEGYCKTRSSAVLPDDIGDDECVEYSEDHTIDIAPLILGAITLELPLQPLCSPDCAGLFEYCDKIEETSDSQSPFSVLKDYKF